MSATSPDSAAPSTLLLQTIATQAETIRLQAETIHRLLSQDAVEEVDPVLPTTFLDGSPR